MVTFRAFQSSDRAWVRNANLRFYQTVHGFDASFARTVDDALDVLESQMSDAASAYLMAESLIGPVGCIFLSREAPGIGRIRLFYFDDAYRRQGTGRRLLQRVLVHAKEQNLNAVRVSTFDRHPEACGLYESMGFELRTKCSTEAFGQTMQQVDYEL